ncbi:hypothetical protein J437_LFUL014074 [Ladona fulva]|uniref:Uncharacterized protein n=1 Tax=Ladona fulva TaxID=123851 RepID=A0A8K0P9D9_LADFU|nr:hypothetical protein J437_LFUL014074 [Ladona fulva]
MPRTTVLLDPHSGDKITTQTPTLSQHDNNWLLLNFGRAEWMTYIRELDKCLDWIPPTYINYKRFARAAISTGKIASLEDMESNTILQFVETGKQETPGKLLHSLDTARHENWMNTVENLDFKNSKPLISTNSITSHIVNSTDPKAHKLKKEYTALKSSYPYITLLTEPFSNEEFKTW